MHKNLIVSDGISTDRINGEFDEDLLICPICTNILWKPVGCKTCENCFCLNCIRLWLNLKEYQCPFSCYFEERKAPGILLKLLSKLKISCENKSNGCEDLIRYEALEKHQYQECQFRILQCQNCSKEILLKDFQIHQNEFCLLKELICLKCSTVYYKKEEHTQKQCLQKQISVIQQNIDQSGINSKKINENLEKLIQSYNKLLANEDYLQKLNQSEEEENSNPSAPSEEDRPIPSAPFEEDLPIPTAPPEEASAENFRISIVNFNFPNVLNKEVTHIRNGYAGFNWENCYIMFEEYVKQHYQLKCFLNSFSDSIKSVGFNGRGNPLSIESSNKFDFHSFECISIYHAELKLCVTGYRSNISILTKNILLTNKSSKVFLIDFKQIDKITFTPTGIDFQTLKPQTFAFSYCNFIL